MNIDPLEKITKMYQADFQNAINKSLFYGDSLKNHKDKRTRIQKIRDYISYKFYDFRIWLAEKIAGQPFDDYYY